MSSDIFSEEERQKFAAWEEIDKERERPSRRSGHNDDYEYHHYSSDGPGFLGTLFGALKLALVMTWTYALASPAIVILLEQVRAETLSANQDLVVMSGVAPFAAFAMAWRGTHKHDLPFRFVPILQRTAIILLACLATGLFTQIHWAAPRVRTAAGDELSQTVFIARLFGFIAVWATAIVLGIIFRLFDRRTRKVLRKQWDEEFYRNSLPKPGEVWWAVVPHQEGGSKKRRPCLVVRCHARHTRVMQITSQNKSHQSDYIPISHEGWNEEVKPRFLEIGQLHKVNYGDFKEWSGYTTPEIWKRVLELYPPESSAVNLEDRSSKPRNPRAK